VPQPHEGVSIAPKLTVEDAAVALGRSGIRRRPPDPGLHARTRRVDHVARRAAQVGRSTPLTAAVVISGTPSAAPGVITVERNRVLVGTGTRPPWSSATVTRAGQEGECPLTLWARGARVESGELVS
jgi:methionyl-tRNA formyltransferase